jgi:drug/metabolite transporter (DMT)-like permease
LKSDRQSFYLSDLPPVGTAIPRFPPPSSADQSQDPAVNQRIGFGGDSPLRAVIYMVLAGLLFPLLNASVKYLGARYPVPEIFWARYAGHVVFCLAAVLPRHGLSAFVSRRPGTQAWRSILLFAASAFYFLGLQIVDLPTAAAISFVGPIIVTALSVPMLGEKVGVRRWTAVLVGFAGAVIIIRPDAGTVQWGAVLILLDALCYAFYQILARKVGSVDPAAVSITLSGIGGFVISTAILPFSTIIVPVGAVDWLIFALVGVWGPPRPFLRHQGLSMGFGLARRAAMLQRADRRHAARLPDLRRIARPLCVGRGGGHHRQRPLHRLSRAPLAAAMIMPRPMATGPAPGRQRAGASFRDGGCRGR